MLKILVVDDEKQARDNAGQYDSLHKCCNERI